MDLKSRQLEAFLATARTGTVSAAAELLHVSQPAVSRLLAHLESQVGLALFDRAQGRLHLTPEGDALLREVERHFVGLEAIGRAARRIASHGPGSLRILGIPSMTSGVLPAAIATLLERHPDTAVTLDTDTTDRIAARVESGAYDVGFTTGEVSPAHAVDRRVIASRPWVCIFPEGHRLAGAQQVSLPQLAAERLVGFSPGMSLRERTDRVFAAAGVVPDVVVGAQTIESICALVEAGCGAAIIHPFASHVARRHGLPTAVLDSTDRLELSAVLPRAPARLGFAEAFVETVAATLRRPGGQDPIGGTGTRDPAGC